MRLGTLARKITITPSKLTAFLESQNIDLSSGTNTKLTEQEVELVLEHFETSLEPEVQGEIRPVEVKEEPAVEVEKETEETEVTATSKTATNEEIEEPAEEVETNKEEAAPKVSESFAEIALPHELEEETESKNVEAEAKEVTDESEVTVAAEEEEEYIPQVPEDIDPEIESYVERLAYDQNIEVIKPAKVKLQGLTVKGKIDLPEPKVEKESSEEPKTEEKKAYNPDEIITTTGPKRDRKRKPKNYKGKKFNKDYNPVEAARKKKEWEEKKRKEQEERRKKKAKAQHYKQTVKTVASTPAKKKTKKVVSKKKQQQSQEPAGNLLQRFWRWMNT